jgi:hypothetical protein
MGHAGFQRWGYRILRSDAVVSFDRRVEKGKDIICTAMLGEKYFKACTRGLDRFNKDELVLVRNDHRRVLTAIAVRQPTIDC